MRHILTSAEKVKGLKAALASSRTPGHLKPFIRKRLQELEPKLKQELKNTRRKRQPGLLDWFS